MKKRYFLYEVNGRKYSITKKQFKKLKDIKYESRNPYDLNEVGGIRGENHTNR